MGYSIAWIAIRTSELDSLFERARVRRTDEPDECFGSPVAGAALEGGWFLLVGQGCDHRFIDQALLEELSARWACVACSIEEHVMFSSSALWESGQQMWSVTHDAQEGIFHLAASGALPPSFGQLRQNIFAEQNSEGGESADVDLVFDIPLLLAREITGFKHDEEWTCLAEPTAFKFLDQAKAERRRWWKPW